MSGEKTKVYIDCTSTFMTGLNTGIQRVVRNILNRAKQYEDKFNYEYVPVVIISGKFYRFDFQEKAGSGAGRTALPNQVKSQLEKFKNKVIGWPGIGKILFQFFIFLVFLGKLVYKVYKRFRLARLRFNHQRIREFTQDDCVLFLDAFWDRNSISGFEKAKREAGSVITIMYDIIPITHPDFLEEAMIGIFTNALHKAAKFSDGFLSISMAVREQLTNYFKEQKVYRENMVFEYFHLGSDFQGKSFLDMSVRPGIKEIFKTGTVWLMVGTIEPRKNHIKVVEAFEKFQAIHPDQKLIILGWVGWKSDPILQRIVSSPLFEKNIFMFNNASDEELEYCYARTYSLIFASYTEGFGLPLVEAMMRRCSVICSDIPIFREIGGQYPLYFDPNRSDSILETLNKSLENQHARSMDGSVMISWDQAAEDFYERALLMHRQIRDQKALK